MLPTFSQFMNHHYVCSTGGTFLKWFLVIRKRMVQNYLEKYSLVTDNRVRGDHYQVTLYNFPTKPHVFKGLKLTFVPMYPHWLV